MPNFKNLQNAECTLKICDNFLNHPRRVLTIFTKNTFLTLFYSSQTLQNAVDVIINCCERALKKCKIK